MEEIIKRILIPIIIVIVVMFIAIINKCIKKNMNIDESYNLKIHYFKTDVAEDAGVISINDKYIMIDTGESSLKDDILSYFKENNINKLDYLIITHFDEDHVGSASYIIDNIYVENVLQSNVIKDNKAYNSYVSSLEKKGITPLTVSDNYEFTLDELTVKVNGPKKVYEKKDSNNSSLITSINYKNTNYIFMGDSEDDRLNDFLELDIKEYDFIKLPYHGRYLTKLESLLNKTKPRYGVITNVKENTKVKNILKALNIKYYFTKNGNIDLYSNGNSIIVLQK